MKPDAQIAIASAVIVLMLMVAIAWWWLPQKWSACQKLYDNKPAQIFCLLASK
jgi:hypothetical protein